MAQAKDIHGTVFRNASAIFMARVENSSGETIDQVSTHSVSYTIFELTKDDPQSTTPVTGHDNVSLTTSNVIFDTLQTDSTWTVDQTGYNFRYELDVSQNEAFTEAGKAYQMRLEINPSSGQKIVFRYQLRCI